MHKKIHLLNFSLGGFFLLCDQTVKHFFLHNQDFLVYLVEPWIGLEYFENPGVAFGIPVPGWLILSYTPFLLFAILLFLAKKKPSFVQSIALWILFFGALSNFIDRIFFTFTIDYIRVFTSILNMADIMIVLGALLLFWEEHKK